MCILFVQLFYNVEKKLSLILNSKKIIFRWFLPKYFFNKLFLCYYIYLYILNRDEGLFSRIVIVQLAIINVRLYLSADKRNDSAWLISIVSKGRKVIRKLYGGDKREFKINMLLFISNIYE